MRFTMICIGSTGDVNPYVLLGSKLKRRGHEVTLCAFSDFQELVEGAGLRFRPISGDAREFMRAIMKPGAKGVSFLKQVRGTLKKIMNPFLEDLWNGCEGAEAMVGTYFGGVFMSIAEARHVPFVQTHYFPMDSNDLTPISSAPGQRAGKAWNKASYKLGYLLINTLEVHYLSHWRAAHGMTPRRLDTKPNYVINGHHVPVVYAMSPLLMPRPTTWDENIHMTGFWLDEKRTSDYAPPPELEDFLAAGEPPVYIGFGSMTSGDMGGTLRIVLEAIRQSGVRAIISTGWGEVAIPQEPNVYVAKGFVPHDWLFERVTAVVHHGGAGTTAMGLLAGKPTLVIPFGGDQPFWAMRVRMMGLGPKPISREKLTAAKLTRALKNLVTVKSYRVAAQEMSQRLKMENGVSCAADIIEREVTKWVADE
ncbi:MAG: glycosyltransferase [Eubacteriales bacterium]|nr:glycosyltransferase [Eubacteriales bacterium]